MIHNVKNMLMKIYASAKVILIFASIYLNNVIENANPFHFKPKVYI
jgi:hypothetical protein